MQARLGGALEATGFDGLIVFAGALQVPPRDDVEYPFRVEPYFAAWAPLSELPGAALILRPGARPVLLYPRLEDFWHAPAAEPEGYWTESFDVRWIRGERELLTAIGALRGRYAAIGGRAGAFDSVAAHDDAALLRRLDFDRARKTAYEIACLARANALAAVGHRAAAEAYRAPISEFELHQCYCSAIRRRESELPYPNIVAQNRNAAILHYQHLDRAAPRQRHSFLIDAGARFAGYAADVTRSYGAAPGRFRELIDAMDGLQQRLCSEVRSGVDFVALNERAHHLLASVLEEHRLVGCAAAEAYDAGLTRAFLPHGLGHLIGLQVHDAGGQQQTAQGDRREPPEQHPFLRLTRTLETGFALTIEPGLYFIPSLLEGLDQRQRRCLKLDAIEELLPCGGVRIEDNLIVESGSSRNLTREAFASLESSPTDA